MARPKSPRAPSPTPHGAEDAAQTRVQGLAEGAGQTRVQGKDEGAGQTRVQGKDEGAVPSLAMLQRQVLLGQMPMHEFATMAARL